MARPRVIIADEDGSYIVPLQQKFVTEYFNKIDLEIITDRAYFAEFMSTPQKAEIIIMSDQLYDSAVQRHNFQNIFVMLEQMDEDVAHESNINQLYKYSSVKEVFNQIIGKSIDSLRINDAERKEAQIIVVTSAAGGVGKTTVSMGIATCIAQNYKRVLYINASRLQCFQNLLDNKNPITSAEVYSRLMTARDSAYVDVKESIRKEVFSYVPSFRAPLLSVGLDASIYRKIIVSAKRSDDYDYIVVDAENTFDEHLTDLFDLANKVIIITGQTEQSVYNTNLLVSNINGIGGDKYVFVCNNLEKSKENALDNAILERKFRVESFISHIDRIEEQKMVDFSKNQEIQKTALLVM